MTTAPDSPTQPQAQTPPQPPRRPLLLRIMLIVAGVLLVAFIAIQFIPVNRTNPVETTAIKWDSPQTQALAQRACLDCHSDETRWPWYAYIAPVSWPVYYDVARGRAQWNLSSAAAGQGGDNGFNQFNDLAFQFGAFLIGARQRRGGDFGGEGERRSPDGQFPPNNGQFPPRNGGFSEGGSRGFAGRATEQIQNGQMPPAIYVAFHPEAVLTDAEKQQLITGLAATLAQMTQTPQGN